MKRDRNTRPISIGSTVGTSMSSRRSKGNQNTSKRNSSKNIRHAYLSKLGFEAPNSLFPNLSHYPNTVPKSPSSNRKHLPTNRSTYCATLKNCVSNDSFHSQEHSLSPSSPSSPSSPICVSKDPIMNSKENNSNAKSRSVSFDETVHVLTIPNKDAYSDRIKKHIWTDANERAMNETRNILEFQSEHWDWRQVTEDVEFLICPDTGEKIHPIHKPVVQNPPSEQMDIFTPLHEHPFFDTSRQAAYEWQQRNGVCSRIYYE